MFSYFKKIGDEVVHPPHRRLMHGLFWSFSGNLISMAITFVITIILARYWGKTGYGEYGIIIATAIFFSEFAGIGLGITGTKYISQHRVSDPSFIGRLLGSLIIIGTISALLFSALFFIFSPVISSYYLNSPNLLHEVKISAMLLFISALNGLFTSILSGFERFKDIAIINLIRALFAVPFLFFGVYWLDLQGAIYALILLGFIVLIVQWIYLKKTVLSDNLKIQWRIDLANVNKIFKFGFSIFITNIFVSLALWLSNVIVVRQVSGMGEVGLMNVANQWKGVLIFIPTVIVQVLLPLLSAYLKDEQKKDYANILNLSINMIILIIYPVCSILMVFSSFIISWYGPTFKHGEMALIGIFLSSMIIGVASVFGPVLQSREKILTLFLYNFAWSILMISSMLIFGNQFGASSYTFGSAIGYLFTTVILLLFFGGKDVTTLIKKRAIYSILNSCIVALACIINVQFHNIYLGIIIILFVIISTLFVVDPNIKSFLKKLVNY